jgi:large subunit ribosomal protein L15
MKLHDLKPRKGSKKSRKRVGRGISAGQGKTAGRGMKGQKARSGYSGGLYRQGGNLPLYRKLPFKRGFTNFRRVEWEEINLDLLANFDADSEVSPETLIEAGIVKDLRKPIVLLGNGEVKAPLKVRLHRFTRGARSAIEAAGGTVEVLEV